MKSNNEGGASAPQSRSRTDAGLTGPVLAGAPYLRVASFLSSRAARRSISIEMSPERVRAKLKAAALLKR